MLQAAGSGIAPAGAAAAHMSAWRRTALTQLLSIELPILGAPLSNVNTPELVAAVSNAGGCGIYGIGAILRPPGDDYKQLLSKLRDLTGGRPFGVNFFVPPPRRALQLTQKHQAALQEWHQMYSNAAAAVGLTTRLELQPPPEEADLAQQHECLDQHVRLAVDSGVRVLSFHFGAPPSALVEHAKGRGANTLGTATTLAEALQVVAAGVDVVVLQGAEAGGHQGCFYAGAEGAAQQQGEPLSTAALLALVAPHVTTPIVVAGGIMSGAAIVGALAAGASGVQMGTAFLGTPEARMADFQRQALLQGTSHGAPPATVLTAAFTGKVARGLPNKLTAAAAALQCELPMQFGLLNARAAIMEAQSRGATDVAMTLCGQGYPLCRALPAAQVVAQLVEEGDAAWRRMWGGEQGLAHV